MSHNQVTMKCKMLSQARGQNCLLRYANTALLKCVELHLLMVEEFGTATSIL